MVAGYEDIKDRVLEDPVLIIAESLVVQRACMIRVIEKSFPRRHLTIKLCNDISRHVSLLYIVFSRSSQRNQPPEPATMEPIDKFVN